MTKALKGLNIHFVMASATAHHRALSPLRSLARRALDLRHELVLHATMRRQPGSIRVYYGQPHVPTLGEHAHGGMVKIQHMQRDFPNTAAGYNTIYLVSSQLPPGSQSLIRPAKRNGVALVFNQNGVAYPAWHGPGWERTNRPLARLLHAADYVFYQSEFCQRSADRYLGRRFGPSEVLYNPVDTDHYHPRPSDDTETRQAGLTLLLGGNQHQAYRLRSSLEILAELRKQRDDVRLIVTGRLCWMADTTECTRLAESWVRELGLEGHIIWSGTYTQHEAVDIYHSADILLHTKYNDPCPGVVLEAMACGLPIVYSASGGVPELVGEEAGQAVPVEQTWDRRVLPDPKAFAGAVLAVAQALPTYAQGARRRAVERFNLRSWLQRHREVFDTLNPDTRPLTCQDSNG